MIITKPYYFDSFKCTASKCTDSCCIGWEIEIDETSLNRYYNEKGDLGKKLSENIKNDTFILKDNEHCPFLNTDGLCELIIEKGDKYLCDICREHPRFYEWYENHTDVGLGLCCEEACRLLFSKTEPITFVSEQEREIVNNTEEDIKILLSLRKDILNHLFNRSIPLSKRFENITTELPSFQDVIDIWQKLEPFDRRWTDTVEKISKNSKEILSKKEEFLSVLGERIYEYEHLSVYLIHRYFMKSLYTYTTVSVIHGVALYLGTQFLWDLYTYSKTNKFDFSDRVDTSKYLSKQLEYSERNIDILMGE